MCTTWSDTADQHTNLEANNEISIQLFRPIHHCLLVTNRAAFTFDAILFGIASLLLSVGINFACSEPLSFAFVRS